MIRWLLLLLLIPVPVAAQPPSFAFDQTLYEGRAYVTGTRAETRGDAMMTALRRVMAKVSLNPAWLDDPDLEALRPLLPAMALDLAYLDRESDIPHHDEQGTRDRPFDLIVHFDPDRVRAALALFGDQPWLRPRPRIAVRLTIDDHGAVFPLTADGENDERMRQALIAAANLYDIQVALPMSDSPPAALPWTIEGRITWSDSAFGWVGEGRVLGPDRPSRDWSISGVSFDEAFRHAVGAAGAALSGR